MSKAETREWFRGILDAPTKPIWRIDEMRIGIFKDKDSMTTEELATKYGMTETRIIGIIEKNCYQNEKKTQNS